MGHRMTSMQDNDRDLLPEGLEDRLPAAAAAAARVTRAMLDVMDSLTLQIPAPDAARMLELKNARQALKRDHSSI